MPYIHNMLVPNVGLNVQYTGKVPNVPRCRHESLLILVTMSPVWVWASNGKD